MATFWSVRWTVLWNVRSLSELPGHDALGPMGIWGDARNRHWNVSDGAVWAKAGGAADLSAAPDLRVAVGQHVEIH
jgi:hypothetical protein